MPVYFRRPPATTAEAEPPGVDFATRIHPPVFVVPGPESPSAA